MASQTLNRKLDARGRRLLAAGRLTGRIEAFIRTAAPMTAEQEEELRAAGVTPYSVRADILAGAIDGLDNLEAVAQLPNVVKIELSHELSYEATE
jgi:hypothetical protein